MAPHPRRSRDLCLTPSCGVRLAQLTLVLDQAPATLILRLGFETWPSDVLAGRTRWLDLGVSRQDGKASKRNLPMEGRRILRQQQPFHYGMARWRRMLAVGWNEPRRCVPEDQYQSHQHFSKGYRRKDFGEDWHQELWEFQLERRQPRNQVLLNNGTRTLFTAPQDMICSINIGVKTSIVTNLYREKVKPSISLIYLQWGFETTQVLRWRLWDYSVRLFLSSDARS